MGKYVFFGAVDRVFDDAPITEWPREGTKVCVEIDLQTYMIKVNFQMILV